MNIVTINR